MSAAISSLVSTSTTDKTFIKPHEVSESGTDRTCNWVYLDVCRTAIKARDIPRSPAGATVVEG